MRTRPEMTQEELAEHALAIATAQDEGQFVTAFAAYVRDVVTREKEPYEKIAGFVHGMVEGQRETLAELMRFRGGGAA